MIRPEKDFVLRTKQIIEASATKYDVSLLINCSFGLVVFPYAMLLKDLDVSGSGWWSNHPFWKKNLKDFDNLPLVLRTCLTKNAFPKTIGELFYKLRNTLCHNRFEPINTDQKLVGIALIFKEGFAVEFEKDELREVLIFVADVYLEYL